MAKYKIVPKEVVKNIIEFLDEVQLEASKGDSVDDLHKINFINWAIGELMNSLDGFDKKDNNLSDESKETNSRRSDIIDEYFIDWEIPEDMTDEDFEKMVDQFDSFLRGWEKEYKKNNPKRNKIKRNTSANNRKSIIESMSLEEIEEFLKDDPELTDNERFELYYYERERMREEKTGLTYEQLLKKSGIKPSTPGKKTK